MAKKTLFNRIGGSLQSLLAEASPVQKDRLRGALEKPLAELAEKHGVDVFAKSEWMQSDMLRPTGCNDDDWFMLAAARLSRRVMDSNLESSDAYAPLADGSFMLYLPNCDQRIRKIIVSVLSEKIRKEILSVWLGLNPLKEGANAAQVIRAQGKSADIQNAGASAVAGKKERSPAVTAEDERLRKITETAMARLLEGRAPKKQEAPRALPKGLQCVYRPMWHVRRQLVTSYVSMPAVRRADGGLMPGYPFQPESADADATSTIDLPLLQKAIDDLKVLSMNNGKAVVMLPLHVQTLDRLVYREELFKICGRGSMQARRLMVFELITPNADLPEFRTRDIVSQIRRWCRAIIVRLPLDARSFDVWKRLGIHAVGVDLTAYRYSEKKLIRLLERFAELANNAGLRSYVHGLPSVSITTAAVCAGFDYVGGDQLPPEVDSLVGIEPFNTQMIFASLFSRYSREIKNRPRRQ